MIKSGRNVPTPAIPMPDLAVPYAAPIPKAISNGSESIQLGFSHPKIIAAAMPACSNHQQTVPQIEWVLRTIPMNGANLGVITDSTIVPTSLGCDVELAGYRTLAQEVQGECG
jgi:hypothetical protein